MIYSVSGHLPGIAVLGAVPSGSPPHNLDPPSPRKYHPHHAFQATVVTVDTTQEDIIESRRIVRLAAEAALESKADELAILDVEGQTSFCDWFILCNGTNSRQIQAIAHRILDALKVELGVQPLGVEGLGQGRWVLIDLGDVLVHIFNEPMRGYYDLDGLWMDAKRVSLEDLGIHPEPAAMRSFATTA